MRQYLRNAQLVIGFETTARDFSGLRISFEVVKNKVTGRLQNAAQITVYNLNAGTRARITEFGTFVELKVGYGNVARTLFHGKLRRAIHTHEGTEWKSTIYANEAALNELQEATISQSFKVGTPGLRIIQAVVESFGDVAKDVAFEALPQLPTLLSEKILTGSSKQAMDALAVDYGFEWGFNEGQLEVVGPDPNFSDQVIDISASTGMVGSPVLTDLGVEVTTLLNPGLRVNRKIRIKSVGAGVKVGQIETREIVPTLQDGLYTIGQIVAVGDTHGNDWLSKIQTFLGAQAVA